MDKLCTRCKEIKPEEKFSKDKYRASGRKSACKECASGDFSKWRSRDVEGARIRDKISQYKSKYGLTDKEAMELITSKRVGTCECCGTVTKLVVDHCHESGKVRGKVCSACNSMLGYAKSDTAVLQSGVEYLIRFMEKHHGRT